MSMQKIVLPDRFKFNGASASGGDPRGLIFLERTPDPTRRHRAQKATEPSIFKSPRRAHLAPSNAYYLPFRLMASNTSRGGKKRQQIPAGLSGTPPPSQ